MFLKGKTFVERSEFLFLELAQRGKWWAQDWRNCDRCNAPIRGRGRLRVFWTAERQWPSYYTCLQCLRKIRFFSALKEVEPLVKFRFCGLCKTRITGEEKMIKFVTEGPATKPYFLHQGCYGKFTRKYGTRLAVLDALGKSDE